MTCSNRNILLPMTQGIDRTDNHTQTAVPCAAVFVPVFCACMIAAGGTRIPPQRLVLAQHDTDRETEFIHSEQVVPDPHPYN